MRLTLLPLAALPLLPLIAAAPAADASPSVDNGILPDIQAPDYNFSTTGSYSIPGAAITHTLAVFDNASLPLSTQVISDTGSLTGKVFGVCAPQSRHYTNNMRTFAKLVVIALAALALLASAAPCEGIAELVVRQDGGSVDPAATDAAPADPAPAPAADASSADAATLDSRGGGVDSGVVPDVEAPDFLTSTVGLNLPPGQVVTSPITQLPVLPVATVMANATTSSSSTPAPTSTAAPTTTSAAAVSPAPPPLLADPSGIPKKSGARALSAGVAVVVVAVAGAVWA
ncbi:uncharacterized protein LOC62_06G008094 [Vanrija pseudolonga]|uniref:Uncharacterized protein n=1 Tax=Vanrija pseudolonga TaxID=143232 RepID=A0AAF0YD66_9TREE|nr:hypothetical protein LOC62_06G008094 [Vanrija pseudolonga]